MHEIDPILVARAADGDREALEAVVRGLQDDVYRLAHRMLWHPADAQDATQEILVKVITRLDGFRGEARFTTWAYRVAVNHLLTTRKRRAERTALTFAQFSEDLAVGFDEPFDPRGVDEEVLAEEVKVGCSQAMLLCLDRDQRAAFVLGDVFELTGDEAAEILEITPAAYRKRLSRARARVQAFMSEHCGLVEPGNACRCRRRVGAAVRQGRVVPDGLLFARDVRRHVDQMERLHDAAAVFRSHPQLRAPERVAEAILRITGT
jgi:RNA polymerase sigma factor (sigma-70 family)